jgi:hypothetical protein
MKQTITFALAWTTIKLPVKVFNQKGETNGNAFSLGCSFPGGVVAVVASACRARVYHQH